MSTIWEKAESETEYSSSESERNGKITTRLPSTSIIMCDVYCRLQQWFRARGAS